MGHPDGFWLMAPFSEILFAAGSSFASPREAGGWRSSVSDVMAGDCEVPAWGGGGEHQEGMERQLRNSKASLGASQPLAPSESRWQPTGGLIVCRTRPHPCTQAAVKINTFLKRSQPEKLDKCF